MDQDRSDRPLPPSHDELLRQKHENLPHPDYPPDYPRPSPHLIDSPARDAAQATQRRLERDEAFVRTTPVAGHDFRREREEREERERER